MDASLKVAARVARRVEARAKKEGVGEIPFRWFREERQKLFESSEYSGLLNQEICSWMKKET